MGHIQQKLLLYSLPLIVAIAAPCRLIAKEVILKEVKKSESEKTLHVISIGINQFDDSYWPSLNYAESDAISFAKSVGEGIDLKKKVYLMTSKNSSKRNYRNLERLLKKQVNSRDTVIFYVSSHGTLALDRNEIMEKVIVLNNTRKDRIKETGLTQSRMRRFIDSLPAKNKLLIIATCHSGIGKSKLTEPVQQLLAGRKGEFSSLEEVSSGFLVLSASSKGEAARESKTLKGDVYTHFFLKGLKINDRNQDGAFSALEAHDFAKDKVYQFTKGAQRPTLEAAAIGQFDIILKGKVKKSALPILQAYNPDYDGFEMSVKKGASPEKLPSAFALTPGSNTVYVYLPGESLPLTGFSVNADKEENITLDELLAGHPFSASLNYQNTVFQSSKMTNILGSDNVGSLTGNLKYKYSQWAIGIELLQSVKRDNLIKPELTLNSHYQKNGIFFGWNKIFLKGSSLFIGPFLGYGDFNLSLQDGDGVSIERKSESLIYGARISGDIFIKRMFYLTTLIQYGDAKYEFDTFGSVDGSFLEFGLGAMIKFGGKGNRL